MLKVSRRSLVSAAAAIQKNQTAVSARRPGAVSYFRRSAEHTSFLSPGRWKQRVPFASYTPESLVRALGGRPSDPLATIHEFMRMEGVNPEGLHGEIVSRGLWNPVTQRLGLAVVPEERSDLLLASMASYGRFVESLSLLRRATTPQAYFEALARWRRLGHLTFLAMSDAFSPWMFGERLDLTDPDAWDPDFPSFKPGDHPTQGLSALEIVVLRKFVRLAILEYQLYVNHEPHIRPLLPFLITEACERHEDALALMGMIYSSKSFPNFATLDVPQAVRERYTAQSGNAPRAKIETVFTYNHAPLIEYNDAVRVLSALLPLPGFQAQIMREMRNLQTKTVGNPKEIFLFGRWLRRDAADEIIKCLLTDRPEAMPAAGFATHWGLWDIEDYKPNETGEALKILSPRLVYDPRRRQFVPTRETLHLESALQDGPVVIFENAEHETLVGGILIDPFALPTRPALTDLIETLHPKWALSPQERLAVSKAQQKTVLDQTVATIRRLRHEWQLDYHIAGYTGAFIARGFMFPFKLGSAVMEDLRRLMAGSERDQDRALEVVLQFAKDSPLNPFSMFPVVRRNGRAMLDLARLEKVVALTDAFLEQHLRDLTTLPRDPDLISYYGKFEATIQTLLQCWPQWVALARQHLSPEEVADLFSFDAVRLGEGVEQGLRFRISYDHAGGLRAVPLELRGREALKSPSISERIHALGSFANVDLWIQCGWLTQKPGQGVVATLSGLEAAGEFRKPQPQTVASAQRFLKTHPDLLHDGFGAWLGGKAAWGDDLTPMTPGEFAEAKDVVRAIGVFKPRDGKLRLSPYVELELPKSSSLDAEYAVVVDDSKVLVFPYSKMTEETVLDEKACLGGALPLAVLRGEARLAMSLPAAWRETDVSGGLYVGERNDVLGQNLSVLKLALEEAVGRNGFARVYDVDTSGIQQTGTAALEVKERRLHFTGFPEWTQTLFDSHSPEMVSMVTRVLATLPESSAVAQAPDASVSMARRAIRWNLRQRECDPAFLRFMLSPLMRDHAEAAEQLREEIEADVERNRVRKTLFAEAPAAITARLDALRTKTFGAAEVEALARASGEKIRPDAIERAITFALEGESDKAYASTGGKTHHPRLLYAEGTMPPVPRMKGIFAFRGSARLLTSLGKTYEVKDANESRNHFMFVYFHGVLCCFDLATGKPVELVIVETLNKLDEFRRTHGIDLSPWMPPLNPDDKNLDHTIKERLAYLSEVVESPAEASRPRCTAGRRVATLVKGADEGVVRRFKQNMLGAFIEYAAPGWGVSASEVGAPQHHADWDLQRVGRNFGDLIEALFKEIDANTADAWLEKIVLPYLRLESTRRKRAEAKDVNSWSQTVMTDLAQIEEQSFELLAANAGSKIIQMTGEPSPILAAFDGSTLEGILTAVARRHQPDLLGDGESLILIRRRQAENSAQAPKVEDERSLLGADSIRRIERAADTLRPLGESAARCFATFIKYTMEPLSTVRDQLYAQSLAAMFNRISHALNVAFNAGAAKEFMVVAEEDAALPNATRHGQDGFFCEMVSGHHHWFIEIFLRAEAYGAREHRPTFQMRIYHAPSWSAYRELKRTENRPSGKWNYIDSIRIEPNDTGLWNLHFEGWITALIEANGKAGASLVPGRQNVEMDWALPPELGQTFGPGIRTLIETLRKNLAHALNQSR